MIKISRISSPLKDKIKNLEECSQLDGDGVFEGKYNTSGSIIIRNKFFPFKTGTNLVFLSDIIFVMNPLLLLKSP
jgi:hypothetical protein